MKGGGNLIIGAAFYIDGGGAAAPPPPPPPPNAMVDPPLPIRSRCHTKTALAQWINVTTLVTINVNRSVAAEADTGCPDTPLGTVDEYN